MMDFKEVSAVRHKTMFHIQSKDTGIEGKIRKALWNNGYSYRKSYVGLPEKPD